MDCDADDAHATQNHSDDTQRHVDRRDQPKREQIQRLIAVLAHGRIVVRFVDPVDPKRPDDEPSQHEAVDQRLRW